MTFSEIIGWFDWDVTYFDLVTKIEQGTVVEVGCYLGRSICYLADVVARSKKDIKIVGVDTGTGSGVENGRDNHGEATQRGGGSFIGELHSNIIACGHKDRIELIVSTSEKAARFFPDNSLQLLFLDARHDYPSVRSDIITWLPKVAPGGFLGGDDIGVPGEVNPIWPGVKQAVSELLPDFKYSPHDAWVWRKPA